MKIDVKNWDGTGTLPPLFSKTATGAINTWLCWVNGPYVCVRWGQQGGATQDASFRCEPKNVGRANATTAEQQAIKEAISKWQKQVRMKYSPDLAAAGQTARLKPMLAENYQNHKHKLTYPVAIQPKLDGLRCLIHLKDGKVMMQSRGGKYYPLPHIEEEIRYPLQCGGETLVLDGELYLHGASLQTITSLAKRPREESRQLLYCIYDVFDLKYTEMTWWYRHQMLKDFFRSSGSFTSIWEVPTVNVENEQRIIHYHRAFAEDGYEGAIIRTYGGLYKEGYRSPDLLKFKDWQDDEYVVKGWYCGKGKFENVPMFICVTPEGKEFAVTPVGSQSERLEMLQNANSYIGKMMKVKYLDKTDEGAPKCARGLGLRDEGDMS